MNKLVVLLFFVCLSSHAISQYNDTLYYKSGNVKPVNVRQHDEKYLVYEYRGKRGKLVESRIALDALDRFVIYNELGEVVYDSAKPKKLEE